MHIKGDGGSAYVTTLADFTRDTTRSTQPVFGTPARPAFTWANPFPINVVQTQATLDAKVQAEKALAAALKAKADALTRRNATKAEAGQHPGDPVRALAARDAESDYDIACKQERLARDKLKLETDKEELAAARAAGDLEKAQTGTISQSTLDRIDVAVKRVAADEAAVVAGQKAVDAAQADKIFKHKQFVFEWRTAHDGRVFPGFEHVHEEGLIESSDMATAKQLLEAAAATRHKAAKEANDARLDFIAAAGEYARAEKTAADHSGDKHRIAQANLRLDVVNAAVEFEKAQATLDRINAELDAKGAKPHLMQRRREAQAALDQAARKLTQLAAKTRGSGAADVLDQGLLPPAIESAARTDAFVKVGPGDSLSSIALSILNDAQRLENLCAADPALREKLESGRAASARQKRQWVIDAIERLNPHLHFNPNLQDGNPHTPRTNGERGRDPDLIFDGEMIRTSLGSVVSSAPATTDLAAQAALLDKEAAALEAQAIRLMAQGSAGQLEANALYARAIQKQCEANAKRALAQDSSSPAGKPHTLRRMDPLTGKQADLTAQQWQLRAEMFGAKATVFERMNVAERAAAAANAHPTPMSQDTATAAWASLYEARSIYAQKYCEVVAATDSAYARIEAPDPLDPKKTLNLTPDEWQAKAQEFEASAKEMAAKAAYFEALVAGKSTAELKDLYSAWIDATWKFEQISLEHLIDAVELEIRQLEARDKLGALYAERPGQSGNLDGQWTAAKERLKQLRAMQQSSNAARDYRLAHGRDLQFERPGLAALRERANQLGTIAVSQVLTDAEQQELNHITRVLAVEAPVLAPVEGGPEEFLASKNDGGKPLTQALPDEAALREWYRRKVDNGNDTYESRKQIWYPPGFDPTHGLDPQTAGLTKNADGKFKGDYEGSVQYQGRWYHVRVHQGEDGSVEVFYQMKLDKVDETFIEWNENSVVKSAPSAALWKAGDAVVQGNLALSEAQGAQPFFGTVDPQTLMNDWLAKGPQIEKRYDAAALLVAQLPLAGYVLQDAQSELQVAEAERDALNAWKEVAALERARADLNEINKARLHALGKSKAFDFALQKRERERWLLDNPLADPSKAPPMPVDVSKVLESASVMYGVKDPDQLAKVFEQHWRVITNVMVDDFYAQLGTESFDIESGSHLENLIAYCFFGPPADAGWEKLNVDALRDKLETEHDPFKLSTEQRKQVLAVANHVREIGGPGAHVTPLRGVSASKAGLSPITLFSVAGREGTKLVDMDGRPYDSNQDYREWNRTQERDDSVSALMADGMIRRNADGTFELHYGDARIEGDVEGWARRNDGWLTAATIALSIVAFIPSGGASGALATGFLATRIGLGVTRTLAIGSRIGMGGVMAYGAGMSAMQIHDQAQHGGAWAWLPWKNGESAQAWLNVGASVLPMGTIARGRNAGAPTIASARVGGLMGGTAFMWGTHDLIMNFDRMSEADRDHALLMLALNLASMLPFHRAVDPLQTWQTNRQVKKYALEQQRLLSGNGADGNPALAAYHSPASDTPADLPHADTLSPLASEPPEAYLQRIIGLGANHETSPAAGTSGTPGHVVFSPMEAIGAARIENAFHIELRPSTTIGVDFHGPALHDGQRWGNVSLKGPYLGRDLQPLTDDQQGRAIMSARKKVLTNTAVHVHVVDLFGLSEANAQTMITTLRSPEVQAALDSRGQRVVFLQGTDNDRYRAGIAGLLQTRAGRAFLLRERPAPAHTPEAASAKGHDYERDEASGLGSWDLDIDAALEGPLTFTKPRPDYAGPGTLAAHESAPHSASEADFNQTFYLATAGSPDGHAARHVPLRRRFTKWARGEAPAFLGTPDFIGERFVLAQDPSRLNQAGPDASFKLLDRGHVYSTFDSAQTAAAQANTTAEGLVWVVRLIAPKKELARVAATGEFTNGQVDGMVGVRPDRTVHPVSISNPNATHAPKPGEVFVDSKEAYTPREKRRLVYKTAAFIVGTGALFYGTVRLGGGHFGWKTAGLSLAEYAGARAFFLRYAFHAFLYRGGVAGLRQTAKVRLQRLASPGHDNTFALIENIANPDKREAALFHLKDQLGSRHATRTGIQDREVYRDAIDTLTLNPADATALETLRQGALERSGRQVVGRRGLFNRIPPGLRREYAEAMRALAANPSDANATALLMTAPDVVRGRHHAGAIRGRVLRNVPHTHRQRYAEAVRILDTQVGDVNAALRTLQGLNLDMVQLRTTGVRGALRGITKANRHSNEMAAETARVNPNDERSLEVLAGTPGQLTDPASPLGRGLYGMRVASFGLSNSVGSRLYLNPIFDPASRQWQWDISTLDGLRNWIGGAGSVVFQWGNATGLGASVAKDFAARYRVHTGKDITVQEADAPQPASQAAEASASNTSGPVDTNRRPLATYGPNNTDRAFVRFLRGLGNTSAVTHAGVNDDGSPMVKPPVIKRLPQWSSWGDTVGMIGLTGADLLQGVAYASVGHWPLAATSLLKVVGDIGMFRGSQKDYLDEYRANHGMGPVTYYSKAFRWFNAPLGNAKVNPTKVSDGLIVRGLPPLVQLGAFTAVRVLADELARQLQPEESQQPTPDVPVDQTESPPAADPPTLSPDEYWSVEGAIERRAVSAGIVETREQRDQTNNKALAQLFQLTGVPG